MASPLQVVRAQRWGHHGRRINDALKVLCVTLGSIAAVVFASLVISIIQFQSRLSEARTQNSSITFESIELIADHQANISKLLTTMKARAEELAPLRLRYSDRLKATYQEVVSLCNALDQQRYNDCYTSVSALIEASSAELDAVVSKFMPPALSPEIKEFVQTSTARLKTVLSSGQLIEVRTKYLDLSNMVRSQCESLSLYVSDRPTTSNLLAVSPELRSTITFHCNPGGGLLHAAYSPAPNQNPAAQAANRTADVRQPEQTRNDTQGVNRLLLSELVFYYKFYSGMSSYLGPWVGPLILAPPEFVTIILVISTGILGSFLFHTYGMFSAGATGTFPSFSAIFLRATLGVMCALVIFILVRTGFVAVTEGHQREGAAAISPFVIAFMSVAAGLLADRALERIRSAGLAAINSGGRSLTQPPRDGDGGDKPAPPSQRDGNAS